MREKIYFIILMLILPAYSYAQTDIYIRGAGRLIPVAVPQLCVQQGESLADKEIPRIISRDLDLSGFFEVKSPDAFIETPGRCVGPEGVNYTDWSVIGVEGLVRGVVTVQGSRLSIKMYLHDVHRRSMVMGKEYEGDVSLIKKIAHRFANEVLKHFTGEYGPFGSQIAFSSRVGRFKELFVMDMDGSDVRQLTNDRGLVVSPSWKPDASGLVYTSYRSRIPDLFTINASSRAISQITKNDALELGAKYKRGQADDGTFLTALTTGRDSDIVLMGPDGSILRRITSMPGIINVSPSWSADNSKIAFCSNRGGGPQIYTMNSDGSDARRISFVTSNYCTSPSWSPRGDKIAYVCRADGGFNIFVSNADGTAPRQLTSVRNNEDPDWSPDSRYITFASNAKGGVYNIYMMRDDGSNIRQLTSSRGGDMHPTWSPIAD